MRKRVILWTSLGLGILAFGFIISIFISKENQMPYYEKTGHHVILSDKIDQLKSSNDKEKVFALARKAARILKIRTALFLGHNPR
ncbi:MAG: hypothetical protein ACTH3J_05560 [Leuconostoc mesenteroides]